MSTIPVVRMLCLAAGPFVLTVQAVQHIRTPTHIVAGAMACGVSNHQNAVPDHKAVFYDSAQIDSDSDTYPVTEYITSLH